MDSLDTFSLLRTAGGLGLFLLGMTVMVDALRVLAGASIRGALMRFTRSPVTGAMTGAAGTALLQSSSATTVAAIGFVGAGLMSFQSALGIVFGANLGTTITGWLVMLVGFKLDLMALMLPLVFVGMLLKLLGSGRLASIGLSITGFGVVFVGIDQMQLGMQAMQGMLDGLHLPTDTILDRLQLVLIGVVFTSLTQSSSAGVAAVLTAMHSEAISLAQGLALVIGMDVGTTATALMATLGGSTGSRRTGISHVVYNVMTAVVAFLLVAPYVGLWSRWAPEALVDERQLVLVLFHTGFNLLGVILVLPVTGHFARLMLRLIPEPAESYTRRLDESLLKEPALAIDALSATLVAEFAALLDRTRDLLSGRGTTDALDLARLRQAGEETHAYADRIELDAGHEDFRPLVACFHVLDHLQRLHERCDEDAPRARRAGLASHLRESHRALSETVARVAEQMADERWEDAEAIASTTAREISERRTPVRAAIIADVARGTLAAEEATGCLESMRWLRRVSHHVAKITEHLREIHDDAPPEEAS